MVDRIVIMVDRTAIVIDRTNFIGKVIKNSANAEFLYFRKLSF
ncbi:MAG: hypothetical protein K0S51_2181 [Bacillales bacterium]|jgi:hypothetical protein|nr:hypothetical protein [Bacillales bacterium]